MFTALSSAKPMWRREKGSNGDSSPENDGFAGSKCGESIRGVVAKTCSVLREVKYLRSRASQGKSEFTGVNRLKNTEYPSIHRGT